MRRTPLSSCRFSIGTVDPKGDLFADKTGEEGTDTSGFQTYRPLRLSSLPAIGHDERNEEARLPNSVYERRP